MANLRPGLEAVSIELVGTEPIGGEGGKAAGAVGVGVQGGGSEHATASAAAAPPAKGMSTPPISCMRRRDTFLSDHFGLLAKFSY